MVEMAMLLALVIVLQLFGGLIKIGPFSLSLVLIPIAIGSIVLGCRSGALLGAVFGIVVVVQCATGVDAGGFILWGVNPFFTALICVVKGAAAGFFPGLIHRAIRKAESGGGRGAVAAVVASMSAPIANTGIFLLGLALLFNGTLTEWAGGTNVLVYVLTGLVGINFIIELAVNTVVSPVISTLVGVLNKSKNN